MQESEPCLTVTQAARRGHFDELVDLIAAGHPVDVHDNRGWKAIHEAAAGNFVDCLEFLLNHEDSDVNWQSHDGNTALKIAASNGHVACVAQLLEHGADSSIADCVFETPLMAAVCARSLDCVQLLVASGSIVNQQSYDNSTALHHAVSCDQPEIVALLLRNGASVELACDEEMTPVFCACHLGRLGCLRLLVDNCRECRKLDVLNMCAADGASPLYLAAQEGHYDCVRLLIDNGADANLATAELVALPLHAALQFNHISCVEALLPVTDHNQLSKCSISPYYYSMMPVDTRATECLLKAGVDVNASFSYADDDEYQPQVLRFFNSEVNFGQQFTPLVLIAFYKYPVCHARLLLEAGASPNACPPSLVSPLLAALDMYNIDLASLLVASGADVNIYHRRVKGNMSLVVCLHYWRGLKFMLKCGAEVESFFGHHSPLASMFSKNSDSEEKGGVEDRVYEVDFASTPIPFWRLLAEARYVMTRHGVTVGQVLGEMLQYTASVRLDERLSGYVDSTDEWTELKDLAEQPRQLAHLCRLRIRQCFTSKQLMTDDAILSLSLPAPVAEYLLHADRS